MCKLESLFKTFELRDILKVLFLLIVAHIRKLDLQLLIEIILEKLIVHHHKGGSHLRLEPLTSEQAAAADGDNRGTSTLPPLSTVVATTTMAAATAASSTTASGSNGGGGEVDNTRAADVAWLQLLNDDANGAEAIPQLLDGSNDEQQQVC